MVLGTVVIALVLERLSFSLRSHTEVVGRKLISSRPSAGMIPDQAQGSSLPGLLCLMRTLNTMLGSSRKQAVCVTF
jgi:hypothetical protein